MTDLDGKVVMVVGGGSGIGRATAVHLARAGASVVVIGRRQEVLDDAVAQMRTQGGRALAFSADFTREGDARRAVDLAVDALGGLDMAVNAVGAAGVGSVVGTEEVLFDNIVATNFKAVWLAMKYQIPAIAARGGGAIVNVSSRAGLTGARMGSAYSGAKHAVVGLTKSAALETGELGIRINAVCPGQTRTAQFDRIVEVAMPGSSSAEAAASFGAKLPLGRIAEPDEIAATIAWLLGPAASFITGAAVPIDGGGGAG